MKNKKYVIDSVDSVDTSSATYFSKSDPTSLNVKYTFANGKEVALK
jgi:hypothetical protein